MGGKNRMKNFTSTVAFFGLLILALAIPVGASSTMWSRTYGGPDNDNATAVIQTSDGGYALAGRTESFSADNSVLCWLIKVDSSGNMEWNQTYGGQVDDVAWAIVEATNGGYAIAGSTISFGAGKNDAWLIKTDEYGVVPEFPLLTFLFVLLLAVVLMVSVTYRRSLQNTKRRE